ncbi:sodium-coupled neutral amino acid transporter 9 homolog isoform X1 [Aethina tumida]|uniref:sodium-coupled neutral amino acid transporter 9 homolog isoform X1 n=1 Tax=Aethina tumida TaxID=116153 RepID=UPI00096B3F7A|nr:sodium-coupled neutral amino acid transporter 9 homolog isoform X1 [Aethina tumida]
MIFHTIVMMRDLMRNYRNIITRKSESDSENESQPLMTSSSSSARSFGAVRGNYIFYPESDVTDSDFDRSFRRTNITETDNLQRSINFPTQFYSPDSFSSKNYYSCQEFTSSLGVYVPPDSMGQRNEGKEAEKALTQNSLVTIFSIWNTTMGSSLLAMSWGFEKSGLFSGIFINILIAGLCLYTCNVLLNINNKHGVPGHNHEVCDLCKELLGRWAEVLAKIFSVIVLIGANIVYWILMSNFLYNSVVFFYDLIYSSSSTDNQFPVICPKDTILTPTNMTSSLEKTPFEKYWDLYATVPIFLALIMFPMLNFKSPTFFTKFNSLGTISVGFIVIFVAVKSYSFGLNLPNWQNEIYLKPTFTALSGMLSLSYFIHNIIISIMRSNRNQEHNGRDLSIAFALITFTYLFLGVTFYMAFPLAKSCIEDNILNNFPKNDTLTIIARILLLFQLFTVFPLLAFMLRNDIFANIKMIFAKGWGDFSYKKVVAINIVLVITCICFACFMPRIGTLIRYTGAASGLVYIFMLPSLLKMASLKKEGNLTPLKTIFYVAIITIGVLNLLSQFLITV